MTTVVNIKNDIYDIWIARGGQWGNPFIIGQDGSREEVIQKFEDYLLNSPHLLLQLPILRHKRLGCFCKPLACHGDILVKYAERDSYSWWLSNNNMTISVTTDAKLNIIIAASIVQKFKGQQLIRLYNWLVRTFGPTELKLL